MGSILRLESDSQFRDVANDLRSLQNLFTNALKRSKNEQTSSLISQLQVNSFARLQESQASRITADRQRSVTRDGNTDTIQTRYTRLGTIDRSSRQDLAQISNKLVQGTVNGNPVFASEERKLNQVSTATRHTALAEQGNSLVSITRNNEKKGNTLRTFTHINSASSGRLNVDTEATRRTETNLQVRRFDQAGNVIGSSTNRQAITAYQSASTLQTREAEGTRDLTQTTTRSAGREGNAQVQVVRTDTSDSARSTLAIDTESQTRNTTLVERLDEDGNVLAARRQTQLVNSSAERTIATAQELNATQIVQTRNGPDGSESVVQGRSQSSLSVVDHTRAVGTVQNLDGNDNLINARNFERDVTVSTDETRNAERQLRTLVTREEDVLRTSTELQAEAAAVRTTRVSSEANGATTAGFVQARTQVQTRGELTSEVGPGGDRTLALAIEETRHNRTVAVSVGGNGQGREVDTNTQAALAVQGSLQFDAATGEVSPAKAAPGAVVVDIGTFSGIRSSFKLDNGVLTFDFTVQGASATEQSTATGEVRDGDVEAGVAGEPQTRQRDLALSSARFQGRVESTVDDAGRRVLTISGSASGEAVAGRSVQAQGQPAIQFEETRTELDFNGSLAVGRTTTSNGDLTTVNTETEASLEVNRVTERESAGLNVRTLTPLTAAEGIRAGFTATSRGLQFNFGALSFGINFVA